MLVNKEFKPKEVTLDYETYTALTNEVTFLRQAIKDMAANKANILIQEKNSMAAITLLGNEEALKMVQRRKVKPSGPFEDTHSM